MSAPVFNPDRATLVSRLRLTGTASGSDAEAIIDLAIDEARVRFYDYLGANRVSEIEAYSTDVPATTDNGIMRMKAVNTEVKMVRVRLLRTLPTMFVDGSNNVQQAWNDEGFTRNANQADLHSEINRLESEIEDALADLQGSEAVDPGVSLVTLIEPECTPPRPFQSINPYGRRGVLA